MDFIADARRDLERLVGGLRGMVELTVEEIEEIDDIVERGLIAVVPIGALGRCFLQMLLVDGGMRGLVLEPLADAVAAPLEKHDIVSHANSPR